MNGNQAQIKISISDQLNDLLKLKAARIEAPEDIEKKTPVFTASTQLEKISEKAIKEFNSSVAVDDIDDFFSNAITATSPTRLT